MIVAMREELFVIEAEEGGERLDKVLAKRFPTRSRSYFQYLLESDKVHIGGVSAKKGEKGRVGSSVRVVWEEVPESVLEPQNISFTVLYEDEYFLAIDKPSGLVVHPGNGNRDKTLVNGLLYKYPSLPDMGNALRPGIVHRLDKETSGIILAVKTREAHAAFVNLFQERKIEKRYLAICQGKPKEGNFQAPIARHPVDRKKMRIDPLGKEAITDFKILSEHQGKSLVLAAPKTGRTHQIRLHLKTLHSPVLGDTVYGTKEGAGERLFLHAYTLCFSHPFTREAIFLKALPPQEFTLKLKKLYLSICNE